MWHDEICKCEGSAGIVLIYFVYIREDMPDNGHRAEILAWLCEGEFLQ